MGSRKGRNASFTSAGSTIVLARIPVHRRVAASTAYDSPKCQLELDMIGPQCPLPMWSMNLLQRTIIGPDPLE